MEIPCEPDKRDELLALLDELRDFDISFLNLNELEITVGNHDNMELRGFNLSTEITAGAAGSNELAHEMKSRVMAAEQGVADPADGAFREPFGFHLKFCTAVFKDSSSEEALPQEGRVNHRPPRGADRGWDANLRSHRCR